MARVLILSAGDGHGALAAARPLVRAGHVVGIGGPPSAPWRSRAFASRTEVPPPELGRDPFLRALSSAVASHGFDVVFGAGDDWMAGLAAWRDELDLVVGHPAEEAVQRSLDKVEVGLLGKAAGLAVPRTQSGHIDPASWPDGAVVKCRRHWIPGRPTRDGRVEAAVAPDAAAVDALTSRVVDAGGEPVAQEIVTGRLMSLVLFAADGSTPLRLQQVASGTWPTPAGVTARAETVAVDDDLAQRAGRLLVALGWSGLMQLEFVIPERGAPVLIDLNGRFYGSMALAVAAGVDFAGAATDLALRSVAPRPLDAPPGFRYQWLEGDLRRALHERQGGVLRDVVDTLRSTAGAAKPVGIRGDSGPALHRARRVAVTAARRMARRP